jgi:flotillin
MLMAPVTTQIQLAKEIGANAGYQQYLITIKQVEVGRDVGLEMAQAMQHADLVIANAGDMQQGVARLGGLFTLAGGTSSQACWRPWASTPMPKQLLRSAGPAVMAQGATTGALVGALTGSPTAAAVAGEAEDSVIAKRAAQACAASYDHEKTRRIRFGGFFCSGRNGLLGFFGACSSFTFSGT